MHCNVQYTSSDLPLEKATLPSSASASACPFTWGVKWVCVYCLSRNEEKMGGGELGKGKGVEGNYFRSPISPSGPFYTTVRV